MVEGTQEAAREAVLGVIDAYNARDIEALLAPFHPDVEWHTTPGPEEARAALA